MQVKSVSVERGLCSGIAKGQDMRGDIFDIKKSREVVHKSVYDVPKIIGDILNCTYGTSLHDPIENICKVSAD